MVETDPDKYADGLAAAKAGAKARGLYFWVYKGSLYVDNGYDTSREASEEESIMFAMLI
jgi:hypothetical protein